ncbi:NAD(P)/FAD-dependent oxidoreductase [Sulfolobus sp. S-194]|uniref:NAD(P)/FAD-dependent oxidoreductase n=1 Tax=Sulfolobus sp. S-194 TaxID=2512240 RepID=UPI001436DFD1|nr:FAD-dependent oxidoreductase [Sulfolobus sp. S-194]QIW22740.1 NAD(P)/FAD-dependent oxidoreductase [Sulfolobus sp. S-194]
MKKLVIVGGGNAGTLLANLLAGKLDITVIEPNDYHIYQPGLVDFMLGELNEDAIKRPTGALLRLSIKWIKSKAVKIIPEDRTVITEDSKKYEGDYLVIATGGTNKDMFKLRGYHTLDEGKTIRELIENPKGKNFVVGSLPGVIKCPAAPWEISFLIKRKYPEANVNIIVPVKQPPQLQVPMFNLFSKIASSLGINVITGFTITNVDYEKKLIISTEGEKINFDNLTLDTPITTNFTDLADKSGLIPVDKETLTFKDGVFVIGDANNTPTPKTGASAHFQTEIVANNILSEIEGNKSREKYRGEAMCAVYAGPKSGALVWLNYEKSKALGPSTMYYYMKKTFTYMYWASLYGSIDIILKPMFSYLSKNN